MELQLGQELKLPKDATIPEGTATSTASEQGNKKTTTVYERIDSGTLGSEVYLVVETANLRGKKVDIEIFDQEKLLAEDDETAIKVIRDDQETDWINAVKIDDTGKAIVKVKLRKKSDEDYKKQQEALKDDKQARLFLKVTCQGDDKKHKIAFVQQMMLITETRGYIDWDFIGKREGKGILNGYVPSKTTTEKIPKKDEKGEIIKVDGNIQFENVEKKIAIGRSGVTIATGFDIGQQNAYGIKKIFKSEPELISKYLPYVDKIKEDAISFLENNPLSITKEQAQKTDELIKEDQKNTVIRKYNSYDMPYKFESQPTGIQTVVMSVSFQYGAYSKHLTDMWKALQEDNVSDLIKFFESQTQYKNAEVKRLNS